MRRHDQNFSVTLAAGTAAISYYFKVPRNCKSVTMQSYADQIPIVNRAVTAVNTIGAGRTIYTSPGAYFGIGTIDFVTEKFVSFNFQANAGANTTFSCSLFFVTS